MKRKKKDDSAKNWSYKNDYPIEEVWNTDNYLAEVIAARLKAFKALDKHGYCPAYKGMVEWNKAIQKMIDAFELLKRITSFSDEEEQTIEEGAMKKNRLLRKDWICSASISEIYGIRV